MVANKPIEEVKEEYIEMNHRKSENAYNIYEAAGNIEELDSEKCPYTGLPAVHLKLMCSPIAGLLTKIEKKLFFAQSKDFYAGILDKWILLYPSKSNDMKPSEFFYPKTIEILKGDNHQFAITSNTEKRYHFQAPNSEEFYEWVVNINRIIDDLTTEKCRESQIPQLLMTRKLPSLPQVNKKETESYYTFGNTPQSINSNDERLYEEPCSSSSTMKDDEIDKCVGGDRGSIMNEAKEENEKPPELPIKTGKKNIIKCDSSVHSYDTPTSNKIVGVIEEEEKEEVEVVEDENPRHEVEINEHQSQCTEGSVTVAQEVITTTPRGVKVSEMTAILSSINLVSPEEKRKSSNNLIKERKSMEDTINNHKAENCGESVKKTTKSPVKRWFSRRIMRNKKEYNRDITPVDECEEASMDGDEELITSVKGSKVNMIINQLEKSGQLKALKKGLKSRKSLVYDGSEEYEPVCVKSQ